MEFLKSNLWEIRKSGSLRSLGGLLALFHVLQFYVWYQDSRLPLKLLAQETQVCWSLFDSCHWLRILPLSGFNFIFYAYVVTAGLAALYFLITSWSGIGYGLLLITNLLGMSLYFQDLRLSSNEGYFIFLCNFAFLIVPAKHRLMRGLVVSFFAARGLSQISPDWLSGSWYMEHLALPIKLAEWLAAVSVLVRMIGGAALLFRDGRYFWTGWIGLFLFECLQIYSGEFLSPTISMGALLYVAFDELELRKAEREYIYQSFIRPEPSFVFGALLIGLFWFAQISPYLGLERTSRFRTTLDVWTLHPEAAFEECEQRTFATFKDRVEEISVDQQTSHVSSMHCNAYLRFLDLKATCKQLKEQDPSFMTLASSLQVQSFRDKTTTLAFEVSDICNPNLTFKSLSGATWNTNPAR